MLKNVPESLNSILTNKVKLLIIPTLIRYKQQLMEDEQINNKRSSRASVFVLFYSFVVSWHVATAAVGYIVQPNISRTHAIQSRYNFSMFLSIKRCLDEMCWRYCFAAGCELLCFQ